MRHAKQEDKFQNFASYYYCLKMLNFSKADSKFLTNKIFERQIKALFFFYILTNYTNMRPEAG